MFAILSRRPDWLAWRKELVICFPCLIHPTRKPLIAIPRLLQFCRVSCQQRLTRTEFAASWSLPLQDNKEVMNENCKLIWWLAKTSSLSFSLSLSLLGGILWVTFEIMLHPLTQREGTDLINEFTGGDYQSQLNPSHPAYSLGFIKSAFVAQIPENTSVSNTQALGLGVSMKLPSWIPNCLLGCCVYGWSLIVFYSA